MISKALSKPFLTFLAGIFFGISLFTFYAFVNSPAMPQSAGQAETVDLASAVKLTKNYMTTAKPMNKVFRGFAVDATQLEAMNKILKQNPTFTGFRIYLGKTARGINNSVVVGINANGDDATKKTMYKTAVAESGPCPSVCDADSPL